MNVDRSKMEKLYSVWLKENDRQMLEYRSQALDALIALGSSATFGIEDFVRAWYATIASRPTAYRVLSEFVKSGILSCNSEANESQRWLWMFTERVSDQQ